MDVEITGTPEPQISWFKDDRPVAQAGVSEYKLTQLGNCYKLILENGLKNLQKLCVNITKLSASSPFPQPHFRMPASTWSRPSTLVVRRKALLTLWCWNSSPIEWSKSQRQSSLATFQWIQSR